MGNMSYCRFENTWPDFHDCAEALADQEPLSPSEHKRAVWMVELCRKVVEQFDGVEDLKKEIPLEKDGDED